MHHVRLRETVSTSTRKQLPGECCPSMIDLHNRLNNTASAARRIRVEQSLAHDKRPPAGRAANARLRISRIVRAPVSRRFDR